MSHNTEVRESFPSFYSSYTHILIGLYFLEICVRQTHRGLMLRFVTEEKK